MRRLELVRVRVCGRCGRGGAELRGEDGEQLVVSLDPEHARQLAGPRSADELRSLGDLVLERLAAAGMEVAEVVIDVAEGRLRALVSLVSAGEADVVGCAVGEGLTLAVRGGLKLYATDEALAHAAARTGKPDVPGGRGGADTLH